MKFSNCICYSEVPLVDRIDFKQMNVFYTFSEGTYFLEIEVFFLRL